MSSRAKVGKHDLAEKPDRFEGVGTERRPEAQMPRARIDERLEAVDQVFGPTGYADAQHALVDEGARFVHVALVVHGAVDGHEVVPRQRQPFENEW